MAFIFIFSFVSRDYILCVTYWAYLYIYPILGLDDEEDFSCPPALETIEVQEQQVSICNLYTENSRMKSIILITNNNAFV